jgi:hypothetical protein
VPRVKIDPGIRTLGTLTGTPDWCCPHRAVLALRVRLIGAAPTVQCSPPEKAAARFLPPPNSVLALRAARGMEGGRRGVHRSSVADDTRESRWLMTLESLGG